MIDTDLLSLSTLILLISLIRNSYIKYSYQRNLPNQHNQR